MTPPRVSLQSIVRQFLQSLKEVVAIGAVELAAQHATVLETDGRNRRGMDRCGRASRSIPCSRSLRDRRAWRGLRTGTPSYAYSWPRNKNWSRCLGFSFTIHLR